jgi:hypothetical protein
VILVGRRIGSKSLLREVLLASSVLMDPIVQERAKMGNCCLT